MGEREDSPFSTTHHRNPKPRCGPSPSQPTPNFAPQEMPSSHPVSVHLPTSGFEVGWGWGGPKSAKLQLPESSWPQEGRDFLVQPHLSRFSLHSCVFSPRSEAASQYTPSDYTLTKEVSGCTLFSEPTPHPLLTVLAFLFPRREDSASQGLSQDSFLLCHHLPPPQESLS